MESSIPASHIRQFNLWQSETPDRRSRLCFPSESAEPNRPNRVLNLPTLAKSADGGRPKEGISNFGRRRRTNRRPFLSSPARAQLVSVGSQLPQAEFVVCLSLLTSSQRKFHTKFTNSVKSRGLRSVGVLEAVPEVKPCKLDAASNSKDSPRRRKSTFV